MSLTKTRYPRAAREYHCLDCGRAIAAGERHEYHVVRTDYTNYELATGRVCEACSRRYGRWPAEEVAAP